MVELQKDDAERMMPLVYEELRRRARNYLQRERADHTLQATALVHESFLELAGQQRAQWKDDAHFAAVAAQLMRRILVEHARAHNREKRGGKLEKVYLDEARELGAARPPDLIALDDALQCLAANHPREAHVVELKFFGGLERDKIAKVLGVSEKTVTRDWSFAKAWLRRALVNESQYV